MARVLLHAWFDTIIDMSHVGLIHHVRIARCRVLAAWRTEAQAVKDAGYQGRVSI